MMRKKRPSYDEIKKSLNMTTNKKIKVFKIDNELKYNI